MSTNTHMEQVYKASYDFLTATSQHNASMAFDHLVVLFDLKRIAIKPAKLKIRKDWTADIDGRFLK